MHRNKGYRKSYGIALCRKNKANGDYEFLLVRRRCTYAFCDFVCGKYMRETPANRKACIQRMFERMTINEIVDIMAYDFDFIWRKVWLRNDPCEMRKEQKEVFYSTFKSQKEISEFMPRLRRNGEDLWGLPKGRANIGECGEMCAVREMEEETGIEKKYYNIIAAPTVRCSHTGDDGIAYYNEFYIAIANPTLSAPRSVSHRNKITEDTIREIDDMRWMSVRKISTLDNANIILPIVRQAVLNIRRFSRGEYTIHGKKDGPRLIPVRPGMPIVAKSRVVTSESDCVDECIKNSPYNNCPLIDYIRALAAI